MLKNVVSLFLLLPTFLLTHSQKFSTGLKLASPKEMAGIPMASLPLSDMELPDSIDLSEKMPPAGCQGKQLSCVAWSVAYAVKSYQEKIEEGNSYVKNETINPEAVFSPSFIYNQINKGEDNGSMFIDALNLVSQQGVPKFSVMPYNEDDYLTKPERWQSEQAKNYKIDYWRQVNIRDVKEVKAQLYAGHPVMIGILVDNEFYREGFKNYNDSLYIWETKKGSNTTAHAMVIVGYDDKNQMFKVLNSWGTRWGNNGYVWIKYDLFLEQAREGFVARDAFNKYEFIGPQSEQEKKSTEFLVDDIV
ncbi:MAG: C1 family peptidase [Bacteroidales bacterium]|nr:C1 family peptidase [Bacteroidales bacterium]